MCLAVNKLRKYATHINDDMKASTVRSHHAPIVTVLLKARHFITDVR